MSESTTRARRRRVPAMAPEERRAAIIAATVPLLREHGLKVSTRQIAQASGVAEGTLFGVFPDKNALIRAAILSVFDPEPAVQALDAIDPDAGLRERLLAALDIMIPRLRHNAGILSVLRSSGHQVPQSPQDVEGMHQFMKQMMEARTRLMEAVATLIEPDRSLLRQSPRQAAQLLFMMAMINTQGFFGATETLEPKEIVSLMLDGLLVRDDTAPAHGRRARHVHGEGSA